MYLSALVDRASERILFMASASGGVDIEQVAASTPEKILTITVNPAAGLQTYQSRELAFALGLVRYRHQAVPDARCGVI